MNQKRIALSALAASVSASALLGVSGVASAEPDYAHCAMGMACTLDYTWDVFAYEGSPIPAPWTNEGGHYDYGWCGITSSGGETCGCGGWTYTHAYNVYTSQEGVIPGQWETYPIFWDYIEFADIIANYHDYNMNPGDCVIP